MNTSATPEWLQENGESSGTTSTAVDPFDGVTTTEDAEQIKDSSSRLRFACSCKTIFFGLTSLAFLALFAYSASTQSNDIDGIEWIAFYSLNAAVPAFFLVYYSWCFPIMAIYLLSVLTSIWSIVYIVMAALKVKNTPEGGETSGTGDNDGQTLREEYIFELAGASIALFSSLYHACVSKFCVNKENTIKDIELNQSVESADPFGQGS